MKLIFVDLLHLFNDQHGIYSLSAVLKREGFDVRYVGGRNLHKVLTQVAAQQPDVLLYSSFTASLPEITAFDAMAKKALPGVKSIIGGPGVTLDGTVVAESTIDAVCIGEGEKVLPDFLRSGFEQPNLNIFLNGETPATQFAPLIDPDELPLPDRELVYGVDPLLRDLPSKQVFSGRGCPYRCTYCFNHEFNDLFKENGPIVRKKSVDYLIEEIREMQRLYPLKNVHFNDDTFIIKKKWFFEFCERFPREFDLTYSCNIRANLVNEEVAEALASSNCLNVTYSLETGNDFFLQKVLKRAMTRKHILGASEMLRKRRVPFRVANLIGLPGETFKEMRETIEINIEAQPDLSLANIFIPFPGLALTKYSIDGGFYDPDAELPRDYFTRSPLKFSDEEHEQIYKTFCLFPVLIKHPALYFNQKIFKLLYKLPRLLLRLVYEAYYTTGLARWYAGQTPLWLKFQMGVRYIRNW